MCQIDAAPHLRDPGTDDRETAKSGMARGQERKNMQKRLQGQGMWAGRGGRSAARKKHGAKENCFILFWGLLDGLNHVPKQSRARPRP